MKRRGRLLLGGALAFCAAALAWTLNARRPIEDFDEGAWIFSTYHYREAPGSPTWKDADSLDHPPLAKLLFGAALEEKYVAHSAAAKERWFQRAFRPDEKPAYLAELRGMIPPQALFEARRASTICVWLACLFTALMGTWVFGPGAGALAAVLLVLFPLSRLLAALAVSDGPFLALLCATAAAALRWTRRLEDERRASFALAALCGALAGLLFDVKLTGAAELAVLFACTLLTRAPRREQLLSALTAAGAFAAAAVLCNPSLWSSPLSFLGAMLAHRRAAVAAQSVVFFGNFFQTSFGQFWGVLRGLFWANDLISLVTCSASAVLALAGVAAARKQKGVEAKTLGLHGALWVALAAATYRIAWIRYLAPALPFLALLGALGALNLTARRAAAAAALAALLAL